MKKREQLTVGTGNYNVEIASILTEVICLSRCNRSSPKSAFVIRRARGVRAILAVGVYTRVTLDVHVERLTSRRLITFGGACERVEGGERVETHVLGGAERAIQIGEDFRVAVGRWSTGCDGLQVIRFFGHGW